jgi:hypothetical protein
MIVCVPLGGLCNRMRAICATVYLSRRLKKEHKILWFVSENKLNSSYEDIFHQKNEINIMSINPSTKILHKIIEKKHKISDGAMIKHGDKKIKKIWFDKIITDFESKYLDEELLYEIERSNKALINTHHEFIEVEDKMYDEIFEPIDKIERKVNSIAEKIDNKTIGIHIRRTDHMRAKQRSPLDAFKKTMRREIKVNSNVKFYLASDEEGVKNRIKNEFSEGRVLTSDLSLNRKSKKGIQGAVVDLYCLSKTKKIYGSQVSTFGSVSSKIGGVSLIRVSPDLNKAFTKI